ncbi:hypothetical protein F4802DRAFT_609620 [Xylaria palmicola]|nr:hypothetical protein F4802DRAFT_609620 [Xylaria palmicola]
MRLLQRDDADIYRLTPDLASDDIPPYAILSHTWGRDEVVFTDLAGTQANWQQKTGYDKIRFCVEQARLHGLRYVWIDTCCIDKSDSIELQTAINSMFRWYRDAKRCYVYLSDVTTTTAASVNNSATPGATAFRDSRWFTRGWTLQELIAPAVVEFYSREGMLLGNKQSLESQLRDITGIPATALRGTPLSNFPIVEREAWVRNRHTKYEEDMAYSLLGIFDVHMPLIYGEGRQKAQRRLREEAQKLAKGSQHNDFSITFSLFDVPEILHFVAREGELEEMRRTLGSDGSRRVVVLHGLGGIGKTQLAVTYAKRYRDEYSAIFWLNIKDETSIQQSFTQVAKQILQQYPDATHLSSLDMKQDHGEIVDAVKSWLSLPGNTRWLLIYDNFDDPKLGNDTGDGSINIGRFLPKAYQGAVIITTRLSQVNLGHLIRIQKLESNDGLQILATTSGRNGIHQGKQACRNIHAQSLTEELDGLPLALATAGAYLRRVSISFATYLRLYRESWVRLHTSTPSLGSYQDRTLCSTWQLSYVKIQEQDPLAAHLLQWWAYFNNEDIWFELLQPNSVDGPAWIYKLADEINFNSAIGTLHDYGFIEPQFSTPDLIGSRGYSIHACVHSWTIYMLNQDWDASLAWITVDCIAAKVPSQDEHQFWVLQKRLLSHAIKCSNTTSDSKAEDMYLRALRGYEKAWGPDHTSILKTVNNLGILYADQGKLQEAEDMYLRALRGYEKAWGPDHTSILKTVNNLGLLYADQGKLQEAEDMYLQALQGKEKAWGPDHTLTLDTVNNLGLLYADQGKLQEAEDMYLRALRGYEKAWGPDHTSTLDTVNNLGLLYADQGKLQEAEDMYLRALRGYEKAIGPRDITRYRPAIRTLWRFGALLSAQGKPAEAITLLNQAHDSLAALLGPSHRDVQSLRDTLFNFNNSLQDILIPAPSKNIRRRDAVKNILRTFLKNKSDTQ